MPDQEARSRVVRLLNGNFRDADLVNLFLYVRDRCDGRQSIKDIGDFVAHRDKRDKGILTEAVRDWYQIATFHAPNMFGVKPDPERLAPDFLKFLKATFKRVLSTHLRDHTGLQRAHAKKLLKHIESVIISNSNGTLALPPSLTNDEQALINYLTSTFVVTPAFHADGLFTDFSASLKSHGLLEKSEIGSFEALSPAVALFAVSVMHNTVIVLEDGVTSKLQARASNVIDVQAPVPVQNPFSGKPCWFNQPIFTTTLNPATSLGPDLLSINNSDWNFPIEVSNQIRLTKLV
jgi:hypothetical protein